MSKKNKKNTKKTSLKLSEHSGLRRNERFYPDLSAPMIFAFFEAVAIFLIFIVLDVFVRNEDNYELIKVLSYLALPIYIATSGIVCLVYAIRSSITRRARIESVRFETEIYDLFRTVIDLPYAISDSRGNVKLINGALQDILGFKSAVSGINLSEFCTVPIKNLISEAKNKSFYLNEQMFELPEELDLHQSSITYLADGRRYEAISYIFRLNNENYYFIVFRAVEDYLSLYEMHEAESPVVAYIQLDNLQELAQYVGADHRVASAEAENTLRAWVAEMNGFIREHTRDNYIAIFSQEQLEIQIKNEFDIQEKIMALKIGDNTFPITVSMGISATGATLGEKEKNAFAALNMAIQRGGNQVAVRRKDSTGHIFFGGTHKTIENNTSIVSRVSGDLLESKIKKASNILIMGHASPDFDSIGSCVGAARFALSVIEEMQANGDDRNIPVNIIVDKRAECFDICMSQLEHLDIYDDIFIAPNAAMDLVNADTVLIICDVNNPHIFLVPELVRSVRMIAMLDHHRMANTLSFQPFLQYIEATKSSASEIVAEILFHSRFGDKLRKEEAEVLLSGIMLDTNNFTRNAGAQTFEITHYLYSRGAHTGVVKEFFNESIDELLITGQFESKARLYKNDIAITWMTATDEPSPQNRILAAKVADNLLKIKGVKASFALIKIGNDVVISGRSKGNVNVQLILERLKGGGHFDIAGAQVKNSSLRRSCEMLKSAIDDYFEYDHHN